MTPVLTMWELLFPTWIFFVYWCYLFDNTFGLLFCLWTCFILIALRVMVAILLLLMEGSVCLMYREMEFP